MQTNTQTNRHKSITTKSLTLLHPRLVHRHLMYFQLHQKGSHHLPVRYIEPLGSKTQQNNNAMVGYSRKYTQTDLKLRAIGTFHLVHLLTFNKEQKCGKRRNTIFLSDILTRENEQHVTAWNLEFKITLHWSPSTFRKDTLGYFLLKFSTNGAMFLQGPHLEQMVITLYTATYIQIIIPSSMKIYHNNWRCRELFFKFTATSNLFNHIFQTNKYDS